MQRFGSGAGAATQAALDWLNAADVLETEEGPYDTEELPAHLFRAIENAVSRGGASASNVSDTYEECPSFPLETELTDELRMLATMYSEHDLSFSFVEKAATVGIRLQVLEDHMGQVLKMTVMVYVPLCYPYLKSRQQQHQQGGDGQREGQQQQDNDNNKNNLPLPQTKMMSIRVMTPNCDRDVANEIRKTLEGLADTAAEESTPCLSAIFGESISLLTGLKPEAYSDLFCCCAKCNHRLVKSGEEKFPQRCQLVENNGQQEAGNRHICLKCGDDQAMPIPSMFADDELECSYCFCNDSPFVKRACGCNVCWSCLVQSCQLSIGQKDFLICQVHDHEDEDDESRAHNERSSSTSSSIGIPCPIHPTSQKGAIHDAGIVKLLPKRDFLRFNFFALELGCATTKSAAELLNSSNGGSGLDGSVTLTVHNCDQPRCIAYPFVTVEICGVVMCPVCGVFSCTACKKCVEECECEEESRHKVLDMDIRRSEIWKLAPTILGVKDDDIAKMKLFRELLHGPDSRYSQQHRHLREKKQKVSIEALLQDTDEITQALLNESSSTSSSTAQGVSTKKQYKGNERTEIPEDTVENSATTDKGGTSGGIVTRLLTTTNMTTSTKITVLFTVRNVQKPLVLDLHAKNWIETVAGEAITSVPYSSEHRNAFIHMHFAVVHGKFLDPTVTLYEHLQAGRVYNGCMLFALETYLIDDFYYQKRLDALAERTESWLKRNADKHKRLANPNELDSKNCPHRGCGVPVIHYLGHGCHTIAGCHKNGPEWCFTCGQLTNHHACDRGCPLFCLYHTKVSEKGNLMVFRDNCKCPLCPDCKPGRPCVNCSGCPCCSLDGAGGNVFLVQ